MAVGMADDGMPLCRWLARAWHSLSSGALIRVNVPAKVCSLLPKPCHSGSTINKKKITLFLETMGYLCWYN